MSTPVRYADYWDMNTPSSEVVWISEDEARRRYQSGERFSAIGTSVVRVSSPLQRWSFTVGVSGDVRVAFFDRHSTHRRTIDYRRVDDRLWCHTIIDLDYPDAEKYYHRHSSTRRRTAYFEPDGHVRVEVADKIRDPGMRDVFTTDDMVVESFWMTRPAFGQWVDLTDPQFGGPPAG